jgi:hypothetical protein
LLTVGHALGTPTGMGCVLSLFANDTTEQLLTE